MNINLGTPVTKVSDQRFGNDDKILKIRVLNIVHTHILNQFTRECHFEIQNII